MGRTWGPAFFGVTVLTVAAFAAGCDTPAESGVEPDFGNVETGWERTAFDVYTQNLYLGGDTGPLFDPAVIANPVALVGEVQTFWDDVQASDVVARMGEIAEEMGRRNPEVVGVQEALQFVAVDLTGQSQPTVIDFLGILQAQIDARGLPYVMAVVQETTSSQLPLDVDWSTGTPTAALLFKDRIAIFKRTDVDVTDTDSGKYPWGIDLTEDVAIERGWARVTVDHEGTPHHFVTTHLETQRVRQLNEAQGMYLLGILGPLQGVTIVTGDLNSDAEAMEGDASYTETYENFIAAGFADMWEIAPRARTDEGYTCCHRDMQDPTSELDERIDFVLVRSSAGPIPGEDERRGHFRIDVVGDRESDMTADGVWPSDHAGLSGSIRNADGTADD